MPVTDPKLKRKLALAGENPDDYDDPPVPIKQEQAFWDKPLVRLPENALQGSGLSLLSRLVSPEFHKGVQGALHETVEGLSSPKNLGLLAASALPIVGPVAAAYFAKQGAEQLGQGLGEGSVNAQTGDKEALGQNLVKAGMGGLMALGGAGHIAKSLGKLAEKPANVEVLKVEEAKSPIIEKAEIPTSQDILNLLNEKAKFEQGTPEYEKANTEFMEAMDKALKKPTEEIIAKEPTEKQPFIYKGKQEVPENFPGGDIHLFDLNEDIPGHIKGSTVSERTLREKGFDPSESIPQEGIPPKIEPPKIEEIKQEGAKAVDEPKEIFWPIIRAEESRLPHKVREAYNNFSDDFSLNRGELVNGFHKELSQLTGMDKVLKKINSPVEYFKQNTPDMEAVVNYRRDLEEGIPPKQLTPLQEKINGVVTKYNDIVRNLQIANNVGRKVTGTNPNYLATRIKPEIIKALTQQVTQKIGQRPLDATAQADALKSDFIKNEADQIVRTNPTTNPVSALKVATKHANEFIEALKSDQKGNKGANYGPIDEAHGFFIPRSWQSNNLLDIQSHYLDRVARRFAYDKNIIKNPSAQAAFKQFAGNEHVKTVHNEMSGNLYNDLTKTSDVFSIVKSAAQSFYSSGRNLISSPFYGAQHMGVLQLPKISIKALATLKQNIAEGFENGRIRRSMHSLELDGGMQDLSNTLKRVRDVVSDVDSRNFGEQIARGISIGQSNAATEAFLNEQAKGKLSITGKKWFNDFGKDTNWKSGVLTHEELIKISGRYVDSVQGTYDLRSLPKWAVTGDLAPYFSLAKWSIDKSNNYMKYVINPAVNGNYLPLLTSTVGILLGGAAVKELYEKMTGRKANEASVKELITANKLGMKTKMAMFYSATGLASASSHLGIVGDTLKSILDLTYGKNKPQLYNNIMVDAAGNIATIWMNAAATINKEGFSYDILKEAIARSLSENIQAYRVVNDHLNSDRKQQIEKSNKERDLRTFDTIAGNDITDRTSPFKQDLGEIKLKKYQKEEDLIKSFKELPELVKEAVKKANGNPEKLEKELGKITGKNYPTMPNMENDFVNFTKYYKFLKETKGEDGANKVFADYLLHQLKKQVKTL